MKLRVTLAPHVLHLARWFHYTRITEIMQNHMVLRGFAASRADPKLWVNLFKPSWRFTAASAEVRERPSRFPDSRLCFCGTLRSEYLDFSVKNVVKRNWKPQREYVTSIKKKTNTWFTLNKMQTIPITKTNRSHSLDNRHVLCDLFCHVRLFFCFNKLRNWNNHRLKFVCSLGSLTSSTLCLLLLLFRPG